jgi:hypothetical protein
MKPSEDLTSDLLDFIRRKFYGDDGVGFTKDKRRLLLWVVLWPAKELDDAGVRLPDARFKEIFMETIMLALQQGNTGNIKYRPAWLGRVIQSHFKIHWKEIFQEAKSSRSLAEHALLVAGSLPVAQAPDSTREMAAAANLLKAPKRKLKRPVKTVQGELHLL